jgi:hypothetical protein
MSSPQCTLLLLCAIIFAISNAFIIPTTTSYVKNQQLISTTVHRLSNEGQSQSVCNDIMEVTRTAANGIYNRSSISGSSTRRKKLCTGSARSSRKKFIHQAILLSATTVLLPQSITIPQNANAFEGGVGGLGKTKPSTGVVYANPENIDSVSSISTPGDYNVELLSPDGATPAFLSFYAPWPMLKSSGIESRDLANSESSFVQVVPLEKGKNVSNLSKSFFIDSIFGQTGKYGMYGTPTDIKVSKVRDGSDDGKLCSIYTVVFTTLTPAMRESDRKVYISASSVGNGVFMLVTGTTLTRFKSQDKLLKQVAESFVCVEAPKSSLRR